jgi:hypothetical protein
MIYVVFQQSTFNETKLHCFDNGLEQLGDVRICGAAIL